MSTYPCNRGVFRIGKLAHPPQHLEVEIHNGQTLFTQYLKSEAGLTRTIPNDLDYVLSTLQIRRNTPVCKMSEGEKCVNYIMPSPCIKSQKVLFSRNIKRPVLYQTPKLYSYFIFHFYLVL